MISSLLFFLGVGLVLTGIQLLKKANEKPDIWVWVGRGPDPFKN